LGVVDAKGMTDGGIEILNGDGVFGYARTTFIRLTILLTTGDTASRHDSGETGRVVITS
jgi:hypothetical protein